ncbi:MAG: MFS transporter [Candidatus Eisenbacteria bacterium]|nr:MFS transporter [Candidatus Eisenbacteria bacterium]
MSAFPALRSRNFRLLWSGQFVSFTGSMMQSAAVLWHVSLLCDPAQKGVALGLVGLTRVIPIVAFSILGGLFSDAHDRRRIMLVTQSVMTATAGLLALLTLRGAESLWAIYLLSALNAAASAFDAPARQSLAPNLVPREHLPNAISLNTTMFQLASVLGPSLAGIAIAGFGVGWVYLLNAISFLAVLGALIAMRDLPTRGPSERGAISWAAAREGLGFVFRTPILRGSMLLDFFATFFSSATALLPIFAQDILRVGPTGYGWLYAAPSIGALCTGAAMVPLIERIEQRGRVLFLSVAGYGLATVGFGLSTSLWPAFVCLALTGATDTVSMVIRNVIRQLHTPDRLRGRMTSVSMIFFMGGPQLGELEAGLVAQAWGAPVSVTGGGLLCLGAVGWIAAKTPTLRRYRKGEEITSLSGTARTT